MSLWGKTPPRLPDSHSEGGQPPSDPWGAVSSLATPLRCHRPQKRVREMVYKRLKQLSVGINIL